MLRRRGGSGNLNAGERPPFMLTGRNKKPNRTGRTEPNRTG